MEGYIRQCCRKVKWWLSKGLGKGHCRVEPSSKRILSSCPKLNIKNFVGQIGVCIKQGKQMLIYEYMPNRTLRENHIAESTLD